MPQMTYQEAYAMYQLWFDAEKALATSQSYSIAGRTLTRINMAEVLERKKYYSRLCDELQSGRKRRKVHRITPMDY